MSNLPFKIEWVEEIIDFIFPPLCLGCESYTESNYDICNNCLKKIEYFTKPFCLRCDNIIPDRNECPICRDDTIPLYAYGNYTSPLKEIIINFKFKGITISSELFARLIYEQFKNSIAAYKCNTLVPIPLHISRENYRGYNQAAVFAKYLAIFFQHEVRTDILKRILKRKPQAKLDYENRIKNINGVFQVMKSTQDNEKIILVDDVVTSGATVLEARKMLNNAGYNVVAVLSIAHAI